MGIRVIWESQVDSGSLTMETGSTQPCPRPLWCHKVMTLGQAETTSTTPPSHLLPYSPPFQQALAGHLSWATWLRVMSAHLDMALLVWVQGAGSPPFI